MKPLNVLIVLFTLSNSVLSACGHTIPNGPDRAGLRSSPTGSTDISSTAIPTASMIQSHTVNGNPPDSNELVEKARIDLAKRLDVPIDEIHVMEVKAVTWSDGSLGCPQEGMMYAQVLTPGYLILLEANRAEYEYHASRGTEVTYCENPLPPVLGTPIDQ